MSELKEVARVGAVTVTADGMIEVRHDTVILRGQEIVAGPRYHRHVLSPGDDLTGQDAQVRAIAEAAWTRVELAAGGGEVVVHGVRRDAEDGGGLGRGLAGRDPPDALDLALGQLGSCRLAGHLLDLPQAIEDTGRRPGHLHDLVAVEARHALRAEPDRAARGLRRKDGEQHAGAMAELAEEPPQLVGGRWARRRQDGVERPE